MAKEILDDATLLVGSTSVAVCRDIASNVNQLSLNSEVNPVVVTNFGSGGYKELLGGLKNAMWSYQGFNEGELDGEYFDGLGETFALLATKTRPAADGDLARFMLGCEYKYSQDMQVGEAYALSLEFGGASPTVRGRILETVTADTTGNGTELTLSAVASNQELVAALFVLAKDGTSPTLDVVVESDDATGFASAETRITFAQMTDVGAQFVRLAGPITDTIFRTARTITGTDPSFTYVVAIGILTVN